MNTCDTKAGTCETSSIVQAQYGSKCGCGGICSGDPMVCMTHIWKVSFFEAIKAVEVDILKVKIQKLWGPKMEKEATALLEAMEAEWRSMHAADHIKTQLIEKFKQIHEESR